MNNLITKKNRLLRWDITKNCNFSCKHCLTSHMYDGVPQMTKEEMLEVIKVASENGVSRIHLLGGEPTILTYIDEIITESNKRGIYVSLNTNGSILSCDLKLCKLFAENKVGVSFSIDGASSSTHDKIRRPGSFDTVVKAAKNYASFANKIDEDIVTAFYITLTPDNKNDDFSKLFEIADNIGVNNIVLGALISMGAGKENYNICDLTTKDILDKTEEFVDLGKKYKNIKVSFPYQTPLLLKYLNQTHNTEFGLCYSKCKAGVQEYQLQPDGVLFPCVFLTDKNRLLNLSESIRQDNNILQNNFESIVSNSYFTSVINKMNDVTNYNHVKPCDECPYNNELDICRPCSYQHVPDIDNGIEFHKNRLCKEILDNNNNNFYY